MLFMVLTGCGLQNEGRLTLPVTMVAQFRIKGFLCCEASYTCIPDRGFSIGGEAQAFTDEALFDLVRLTNGLVHK